MLSSQCREGRVLIQEGNEYNEESKQGSSSFEKKMALRMKGDSRGILIVATLL